LQHVLAIESHPSGTVSLVEVPAGGKLSTAIEHANIIEPEKSAGEDVLALRVFSVDPPIEIQHQALKGTLQEAQVRSPEFFFNVGEEQRRPRVHGRVYVAEIPLVGRDLPVRV